MSTNLFPVLVLVLFAVVLLLALLGGVFWYLRRSSANNNEETEADEAPVPDSIQPAPKADTDSAPARPATKAKPAQVASPAAPLPSPVSPKPLDGANLSDKIKILIVDDNPETRENVSRLLYFEDDMDVIGQAVNGQDGIEQAIALKPHIVLMDINMPDMDGISAAKEMSMTAPYSQVIMMSVQAEQHYMKQAMAAGARDFQPKPFTADELINCIHRVYKIGIPIYQKLEAAQQVQAQRASQAPAETARGEEDAPVIVVYSPKGGIGTSALATNLAIALQQEFSETVLMDADLQFGDVLVHLNTRATRTMSDLIHENGLDIELLDDVVLSHSTGLKLLLAPPQPELADAITPEMVTEIIKGLKRLFKLVVIDTNCKLNDATMAVLDNADYVLMVTTPELPAVKSAKLFLELAELLEFGPNRLGVVINRANLPGGINPKQIGKVLKLKHAYFVPYDSKLYLATSRGTSIIQEDPSAPSARAIKDLARQLRAKLTEPESQPVKEAA